MNLTPGDGQNWRSIKLLAPDIMGRLQAAADVAIWKSHYATARWELRRDPARNPPEEDFVASFVLRAVPDIAAAWQPFFQQQRLQLSITAVFCHNTPKASFKVAAHHESPELADLLIVRRHQEGSRSARQVAVLVQAKMSDTGRIHLANNDPQLYLYNTWPEFRLVGRNAPTTSFCVGRNSEQCVYAGISSQTVDPRNNPAWSGFSPWALMSPKQEGWVDEPLSAYLIRILNFGAGREFFDLGISGCHWSELIHYLLQNTFSLPLRTRDMRLSNPRGMTFNLNRMAFMLTEPRFASAFVPMNRAQEIQNGGEARPPEERSVQFEDGGEGRVLLIETSEPQG